MSSETQVVLEVDAAQVVLSREKASSAWSGRWKMCMALLAVAVCVAAAVFFTFNKVSPRPVHRALQTPQLLSCQKLHCADLVKLVHIVLL